VIVADWLHCQAQVRPLATALVAPDGEVVSYAGLEARVAALQRRLRGAAVGRGDRLLALLPTGTALVELVHAVARAGGVLAPLDPRSTSAEALRAAALLRPRIVLAAESAEAVAQSVASACGARLWLGAPNGVPLDDVPALDDVARDPCLDLAAPHTVVFTSGTTGKPRGVVLSAGNHLASVRASAERLATGADDRWLACLPLHHVGGLALLLRAAISGGAVILQRGFTPATVLHALRADRITQLSLVPTALRRLLDTQDADPCALRVLLLGGARAARGLVEEARARGWPVAPTYGLTEACSQVATACPQDDLAAAGFVGTPLAGTRVRILRQDGALAAAGEVGEIEVCGPTVACGVLADDGSVGPLARDGWLRTADRGALDAGGGLTVLGRGDDVIVTGGENVTPDEVEAALLAHPGIADAAVAGVADGEWGQVLCAWIVPRAGAAAPTLEEVRRACAERLARHKLPRRLVLVDALPRTTSGKVKRRALVTSLDEQQQA
jgi:O-succinylbenzoic acid--CoA ligase